MSVAGELRWEIAQTVTVPVQLVKIILFEVSNHIPVNFFLLLTEK